jgi:hypothetical protein
VCPVFESCQQQQLISLWSLPEVHAVHAYHHILSSVGRAMLHHDAAPTGCLIAEQPRSVTSAISVDACASNNWHADRACMQEEAPTAVHATTSCSQFCKSSTSGACCVALVRRICSAACVRVGEEGAAVAEGAEGGREEARAGPLHKPAKHPTNHRPATSEPQCSRLPALCARVTAARRKWLVPGVPTILRHASLLRLHALCLRTAQVPRLPHRLQSYAKARPAQCPMFQGKVVGKLRSARPGPPAIHMTKHVYKHQGWESLIVHMGTVRMDTQSCCQREISRTSQMHRCGLGPWMIVA